MSEKELYYQNLVIIVTVSKIASGPLKVHPRNPRYFTDGSGKAVYLTGIHTWSNLQEYESDSPFNYEAYLDFLQKNNYNFTRLWTWECGLRSEWMHGWSEEKLLVHPLIYKRTGPGTAFDGKPKFDLTRFNQEFFDRLRERVKAAGDRGIYVSVMLFQGWDIESKGRITNPWDAHPFNKHNNINGIDGDPKSTGIGRIHTLDVPAITRLQELYVRKVIDTLNDLDNVLYEISNESYVESMEWQCHMVNYIHNYEKNKPKQHPVGITVQYSLKGRGVNLGLFNSPADWISPNTPADDGYNYCYNPPPADGTKIVLLDTDHLWGIGGDSTWVWKAFTRGYNPIFMDPYDSGFMDPCDTGLINVGIIDSDWDSARKALGQTRMFADRMNLVDMIPHPELAHTRYCLANPNVEYLIYRPPEMTRRIAVDLSKTEGEFLVEWFNPDTGISVEAKSVTGGKRIVFVAPFNGGAVLYLKHHTP